jgi:hypothetical protein
MAWRLIKHDYNFTFKYTRHFFKILFNIVFQLGLEFLSVLTLSGFLTKILCKFLISLYRVTCPTHLIFLSVIILVMFIETYKLCRSSLCIASPFYSFLLLSFKYFPHHCVLNYFQFMFFP